MSSQTVTSQSTQYAMKKRKRPQPRSKNAAPAVIKSNPSKRHRDRLNSELDRLSQLLPLPIDVVNKLDKLSILRLSVAYLRNKGYSSHISENDTQAILPARNQQVPSSGQTESELALQALDGFIMIVTQDFNVFYITPNVQECLGFPQSDVMYQSMLDLIHAEDRKLFMKQMMINPMSGEPRNPPDDGDPPVVPDYVNHGLTPDIVKKLSQDGFLHRSFICRLRCLHDTSSGFLALHFTGHLSLVPGQNRHSENGALLPPELGLFIMASPLQTPSILEIRTKNYIFRTKHKLDYTPLGIDQKGRIVLGYTEHELRQQSGYQFIHSADMMHCADSHTKLMRKGQSGLTVFRLLHRANRWQWVTASARLIFAKGIPDYIISTHRPITEQEGEEHLKKRSNAFRFDFTGHASLYASVNPIGAGPPPSNNNYGSPPESKPHITGSEPTNKRARISNGVYPVDVDPATLFGAQSFQTMDNYPEGLPIIKANDSPIDYIVSSGIVKAEPHGYSNVNDVAGYFKQNGDEFDSDSPENFSDVVSPDSGFTGDKLVSPRNDFSSDLSDSDLRASPGYTQVLELLLETEPPPLHHPPITEIKPIQQQYPNYQPQANGYTHQQHQPQIPRNNPYDQPRPEPLLQRPGAWNQLQNHQPLAGAPQYNMHQQPGVHNGIGAKTLPQVHSATQPAGTYNRQSHGYTQAPPQSQLVQNVSQQHQYQHRPQQHTMPYQANHVQPAYPPSQQLSTGYHGVPTQSFVGQIQNIDAYNQHMPNYSGSKTTAAPKKNVSILNSLEISSTVKENMDDQQYKDMEAMLSMLGPSNDPNSKADQFEATLEVQETTLQFDMHRIAAEYQTMNPLGVIQNFVQNNPTEAFDIATGNIPDSMMRNGGNRVPPNTPATGGLPENFLNCQFDDQGINKAGYVMLPMRNNQPIAKHGFAYNQQPAGMIQPIPGINQSQPGMNQPGRTMNLSKPIMKQSHPGMNQLQPGMNQPGPTMNLSQPIMKQTHPGMNQSQVGMHQQQSGINQSQPGMNFQNNMHQPIGINQPNVKTETKLDPGLNFDIEEYLSLDIPSIEGVN